MAVPQSLMLSNPNRIPAGRYYDEAFFKAEAERLWKRCWQPACHLHEIPEVGDFREYRILDQSFLIVRDTPDTVKAFRNACRHRGVALGTGSGCFADAQIVCPFHGWRYNLDGSISYVFGGKFFTPDCMKPEELNLQEVRAGIRFGFVWIHPQPDGESFDHAFSGIDRALDPVGLDRMHVDWWHRVEMKGNWKIAQEAFQEGFHSMQTHPELVDFHRDNKINVEVLAGVDGFATDPKGHGWLGDSRRGSSPDSSFSEYIKGVSPARNMITTQQVMWEGARSLATQWQVDVTQQVLDSGVSDEDFLAAYMGELYAEAGRRGIPLPQANPDATSHATVFPNFTLVAGLGTALIYRSRPLSPDTCEFDFWSMSIPPEGTPVTRAVEGNGPAWEDLWFVHQDVSNIELQQIGIRSDGYGATRMSSVLENMITNWHQALDKKLAAD